MLQSQLHALTTHASGDLIQRIRSLCDLAITIGEDTANGAQKIVKLIGEREQVGLVLQALFQMFQQGVDPAAAISAIPVTAPYSYSSGPSHLPAASVLQHQHYPRPGTGPGHVAINRPSMPPDSGGRTPFLALGADGMSGYLYERSLLPDGYWEQVAMVKRAVCGRVVGKGGNNLALFKAKTGALVAVEKTTDIAKLSNPNDLSRVVMVGDAAAITMGAQLLQEVISNGSKSMGNLPDASYSLPPGYNVVVNRPGAERPPQPAPLAMQGHFPPQAGHTGRGTPYRPQQQQPLSHHANSNNSLSSSGYNPSPRAGGGAGGGGAAPPGDVYPNIARISLNSNPTPAAPSSAPVAPVEVAPCLDNALKKVCVCLFVCFACLYSVMSCLVISQLIQCRRNCLSDVGFSVSLSTQFSFTT